MQKRAVEEILRSSLRKKLSKLSKAQEDEEERNNVKHSQQKTIAQAPLVSDQTPRFVHCVSHDIENGNIKEYIWDEEKIFVHECLRDDLLMLQNVFEGKIISSLVYPLVFECKSPQKEISLRSIEFYKEVQSNHSLYHKLSPEEKGYFFIGIRDLFLATFHGVLGQEEKEKELLTQLTDLIDPNDSSIIYKTIDHIEVAPYPTASHKMVRFFEVNSEEESNILDECFVQNELGLLIGFVDPRDLSFHNFENIINLDSLFKAGEDFPIKNFRKHGDNGVYTFDLEDKNNTLLSLDKCGLYTQPINKLSRGGERFIFASKKLGDCLTDTLKSHVSEKSVMSEQFQFVNYVFRYNKFKPSDSKFTSHFDTPYHDPTRKHYSKYTLILYLTTGAADPVLSIDNGRLRIDRVENNPGCVKGVIFDQKYEHEGRSFIDSDKIFLRSELIYEYSDKELSFNAEVSRKFNIACYMTKQSVFNPELEKYASDCFNQVAQARLDLAKANLTKDVLLYKIYHGVPFITNGYDYWFLKNTSLKTAALVTILDWFGGKYMGIETKDCGSGLFCAVEDIKDIFKHLKANYSNDKESTRNIFNEMSLREDENDDDDIVESLKCEFEEEYASSELYKYLSRYDDKEDCYFCESPHVAGFDLCWALCEKNNEINKSWVEAKKHFMIFIFNKEIKIEKSKIQINPDSIIFNEDIPSINFASCQWEPAIFPPDYVYIEEDCHLDAIGGIPPIPYKVHNEGYHLKIELFNNGFIREESIDGKRFSYRKDLDSL